MTKTIANHTVFERGVHRQLTAYFERIVKGLDISPAQRFRLEGFIAAGIDAGLLDGDDINTVIENHVQTCPVIVSYVAELSGQQTLAPYVFCSPSANNTNREAVLTEVRLPYLMPRAPVLPSS